MNFLLIIACALVIVFQSILIANSTGINVKSGILENVKAKKCLHIKNEDSVVQGELNVKDCDLKDLSESLNVKEWKNYETKPGYLIFDLSGLCATVKDAGTANEVRVLQDTCQNLTNQKWKIYNGKYEGKFQLQNVISGKCLVSEGNGIYMDQYTCEPFNTSPHQYWKIIPPPPPPCRKIDETCSDSQRCCRGLLCGDDEKCFKPCRRVQETCSASQPCCGTLSCGDNGKCCKASPEFCIGLDCIGCFLN